MANKKSVSKSSVVKSTKHRMPDSETYRPTVYIDSAQSRAVKKVRMGQRVNLMGIVTSITKKERKGQKSSTSVNIEIKRLKK